MNKLWSGSGDVRGDHAVGSRPEGMAGWQGLRVGDIEDRAQVILLERFHERFGVYYGSSSSVDQQRAALHQGELCGSEHSLGFRGEGHDDDDDVGLGQEDAELIDGEDLWCFARGAGEAQDFGSEWCQAGFDGCSN